MILNVWLYRMNFEGARLLELHRYVSDASGMSHHEYNQTAVGYSSQFLTKQKQMQVWKLQYLSGICEYMPNDAVQGRMSEQYLRHVHS